jgi:hypothetical protein
MCHVCYFLSKKVGLMVLPKKLKFIKKEATPKEGLLHRFFVSGYTLTVLATKVVK